MKRFLAVMMVLAVTMVFGGTAWADQALLQVTSNPGSIDWPGQWVVEFLVAPQKNSSGVAIDVLSVRIKGLGFVNTLPDLIVYPVLFGHCLNDCPSFTDSQGVPALHGSERNFNLFAHTDGEDLLVEVDKQSICEGAPNYEEQFTLGLQIIDTKARILYKARFDPRASYMKDTGITLVNSYNSGDGGYNICH